MKEACLLCVANYDAGVGYAWWLMESFWAALAHRYRPVEDVVLAYPRIDLVPPTIQHAPLRLVEVNFRATAPSMLWLQCQTIRRLQVRTMYLTDQPSASWRYVLYRCLGVRTIIVHDHTPGQRIPPVGWKRGLKKFLHSLPVLRASGMIGATPFVSARHRDVNMFPAERTFTATNGLRDFERGNGVQVRQAFGLPPDTVVIVSVGRLSPIKGVETILTAVALLVHHEGCPKVHHVHFGDGPLKAQLTEQARNLGVSPWVTFAGKVEDVRPYLATCDIAIHASRGEVGFSLSVLEFMQAGLPVVVSDDPSVNGATCNGESGLLFAPGDAHAAASALKRLVSDPQLRHRLGARAAQVQSEQFTLKETHRMLLDSVSKIREMDGDGA